MTSTSQTHSSAHPPLTARYPLSSSSHLRPSPLTASLTHTAYQARLGPPVHTLSEAPPLTPALLYSTVTSILHRFQPAWRGCPYVLLTRAWPRPFCFLPRAFLQAWWDPTRTHAAHSPVQPTRAGASGPRRHPLGVGIRKPLGKCSPRADSSEIHSTSFSEESSNQSPIAMTDSVRKLFIIQRFSGLKQQARNTQHLSICEPEMWEQLS